MIERLVEHPELPSPVEALAVLRFLMRLPQRYVRFRSELMNHEAPVSFGIVALVADDRHDRGAVLDSFRHDRPQTLEVRVRPLRCAHGQYRQRSRVDDERELDVTSY